MANVFQRLTDIDFNVFLAGSDDTIENLKFRGGSQDTETHLSQLAELRVNKPDPSKVSIDDIVKKMGRRRFLLRPSYQRGEVISPTKASGIIESLLLGVALPPIFVFRRKDDVSEVVDGQQRLLTILGFIGESYRNEKNEPVAPKNHRFALRDLRILTELSGKRFEDLSESQQGKIFDFELFLVEIQEALNPNFNPVDLFVRLNDKPYPIKEHSFEMWNSWADKDCITKIRDNTERAKAWFYVKKRQPEDRYRMLNEELYTSLILFDYNENQQGATKYPTVFSRRGSVAARIKDKAAISGVWTQVSEAPDAKKRWLESTNRVESFLRKLKIVLIDRDVDGDVDEFLRGEVDQLVRSPDQRYAVRSSQDFYFLWLMLSPLNLEMIRFHRLEIKAQVTKIIQSIKSGFSEESSATMDPLAAFQAQLADFHSRYQKEGRNLKLTAAKKAEMIRKQGGTCAVSGAPIFVGDEVVVDHTDPLAIGGRDAHENVQIATPEANSRKGSRLD